MNDSSHTFCELLEQEIQSSVFLSLCQDLGILPGAVLRGGLPQTAAAQRLFAQSADLDVTAHLVPQSQTSYAKVICKEDCVFVGQKWVDMTFELLSDEVSINWHKQDGQACLAGDTLFELQGNTRAILTGERTALNFSQTLSATATSVNYYARLLEGSHTQILDTRKTLPMMRYGQKYAVKCGGGENHRIGLYDRFLIKENHIMGCGSITEAVNKAKANNPHILVEVEVENLTELEEAIASGVDIVMLDNFDIDTIHQAVTLRNSNSGSGKSVKLEVSGNVEAEHLKKLADTGVDFVSSGAITKHVNAVDLSLRLIPASD